MKRPLKQDATFAEYLLHDSKWALIVVPIWMLIIGWQLGSYEPEPGFGGAGFMYGLAAASAAIWLLIFYKLAEGYGDHIRGRSR